LAARKSLGVGPVLGDAFDVSVLPDSWLDGLSQALGWPAGDLTSLAQVGLADGLNRGALSSALAAAFRTRVDLARIATLRLRQLAPGAALVADGPFAPDECDPRLRGAVDRAGWDRWSVLLDQRVSSVAALPNVGPKAISELVEMCVQRSVDGLIEAWASDRRAGDLGALLRHERGRSAQPLSEALLEQWSGDGSASVREAAGHLLRQHAPWAVDPKPALMRLLTTAGDDRSQRLFTAACLCPDGKSFEQLAREETVSSQRVGQIVHNAAKRVREALAASPGPLPWFVSTVQSRLGSVTTDALVTDALGRLGVDGPPAAELLCWLAGPYRPVPACAGWLAVDPKLVAARTSACLAADRGVGRLVDVEAELVEIGMRTDQVAPWLRACSAVLVHDLVVSVSGPLPDVIERVLDAHGVPRSVDEIAADIAAGGRQMNGAMLDGALRSRRFRHTTEGGVRLAAWAEEKPGAEPERRRRTKEPTRPALHVPDTPAGDGRLWLWVRVDDGVLHGSEAAVPVALVEGLGLAALARRTFSSRWGPVTLAHEGLWPTRGSVRAVALAVGARCEDTLLLGFSTKGDVVVEVHRGPGRMSVPDGSSAAVTFPEVPEVLTGGAE